MAILLYIIEIYTWIVLASVLLSWVPSLRENVVGHWIESVTEPVFAQVRKVLPPLGGLDLTPLAVLLLLRLIRNVLLR